MKDELLSAVRTNARYVVVLEESNYHIQETNHVSPYIVYVLAGVLIHKVTLQVRRAAGILPPSSSCALSWSAD